DTSRQINATHPHRRFDLLLLAFRQGQIPDREGHRERRPSRLRRRRDSAPPDGERREEVSEQPEADGLRQRPRPLLPLDTPEFRRAQKKNPTANNRPNKKMH